MEHDIKILKHRVRAKNGAPRIIPQAVWMRLIYLLSVVGPWILIVNPTSVYQVGASNLVFILFHYSISILFAPFLAYSSVSMLLLLWSSDQFSKFWYVRFGIYTGCILALQFALQLWLLTLDGGPIVGLSLGLIFIVLLLYLTALTQGVYETLDSKFLWRVIGIFAVFLLLIVLIVIFTGIGVNILVEFPFALLLACGLLFPILMGLTAYRLWIYIGKDAFSNNKTAKIGSLLVWLLIYVALIGIAVYRIDSQPLF